MSENKVKGWRDGVAVKTLAIQAGRPEVGSTESYVKWQVGVSPACNSSLGWQRWALQSKLASKTSHIGKL